MRTSTLLCAVAALALGQSAMSAVVVPTLGAGTPTYTASQPTGSSYAQVHAVPTSSQAQWMPKGGFNTFPITPAAGGSVVLNLGATVRWQPQPTDQWNGPVNDLRRYFSLGYSTDGGANVSWTNASAYYPKNGYSASLSDMPSDQWTRIERQYSFTVQTLDGSTPVSWFYRDDRVLDVARYGGNINPVDVSFDDVTITVNGTNLMTAGNFEYGQATLDAQWGFWQTQATSTQMIAAVPEPTLLGTMLLPIVGLLRRKRA